MSMSVQYHEFCLGTIGGVIPYPGRREHDSTEGSSAQPETNKIYVPELTKLSTTSLTTSRNPSTS